MKIMNNRRDYLNPLTSRERLLRTIQRQEVDHLPCAFMSFTALRRQVAENLYELSQRELAMGLDSFLFIPSLPRPMRPEHPELRGLPVRFQPEVETFDWQEEAPYGNKILHKKYSTPAGELSTAIRVSDDWPHGNHIPFIDDFQVPRSVKPLITERRDLEPLAFLLTSPAPEDIAAYRAEVDHARLFKEEYGVLLVGGWGVGMDMANWLCGVQNLMAMTLTDEAFVTELLDMIHLWNMERMKVVLAGGIDLFIKRAWYEGCDFVTPTFYQQVILPRLRKEIDLVHESGAKFGYICSSGLQPMLDLFKAAGMDMLIGIDPVQGTRTDMPTIKEKIGGEVCLWGGVSGAVTVEMGTEEQIRMAVSTAIQQLGPQGFILSPVDNITEDTPATWQNIDIFIDEWRKHW